MTSFKKALLFWIFVLSGLVFNQSKENLFRGRVWAVEQAASGLVDLSLSSEKSALAVGEILDVDILVETGEQPVVGIEAYLDFDPHFLLVVDENGQPANQIKPGSTFTELLLNEVNNSQGQIGFAAGNLTDEPPSGNFSLASIRFQALASTQGRSTTIAFSRQKPRQSSAVFGDQEILAETTDLSLIIGSDLDCPSQNQGNLDCDVQGKIDEKDLSLLLLGWGSLYTEIDLLNLLNHWRP